MPIAVRLAAVVLAFSSPFAHAQWLPQWLGIWQHPEPFRDAGVHRLRTLADGTTFASIDVGHHGSSHATLARFDADGAFAWLREYAARDIAAIELTPDGRVALVGTSAVPGATIDVRVYDAAGVLAWSRTSNAAWLRFDARYETRQLAVDAAGNLFVLGSDGADFVVLRYAANGDALPAWRHAAGDENVLGSAILALPDGGAVVGGQSDAIGGGYRTVRFDATGAVRFDDAEAGDIGNPLGPSMLAATPDGGFLVAASPESTFGVPKATVWKLAADGARAWTTVLPNPGAPMSFDLRALVATPDGDALVVADAVLDERFRLMRLRGADGAVIRNAQAAVGGHTTSLALAPNGRALVGGFTFANASGAVTGRVAEFDANGAPCRTATDLAMFSNVAAAAGAAGWILGGTSAFVQGVGNDVLLRRHDADGACADAIFGDGFEEGA